MLVSEKSDSKFLLESGDVWNLKVPMRKYERIRIIRKPDFEKNACKMGLGTVIKTENEEIKGEGTWSRAACPRWPCCKCGLL